MLAEIVVLKNNEKKMFDVFYFSIAAFGTIWSQTRIHLVHAQVHQGASARYYGSLPVYEAVWQNRNGLHAEFQALV